MLSASILPQHARAAALHRIAPAVAFNPFEQLFHALDLLHPGIEFRDLLSGEFPPTRRDRGRFGKAKKQLPDLLQSESDLLRPSQNRQSMHHGGLVTPAAADA